MDNSNKEDNLNIVNNLSQQEAFIENQNLSHVNNFQEFSSDSNLEEEQYIPPQLEIQNTANINLVNQEIFEEINENVIPSIPFISTNIPNQLTDNYSINTGTSHNNAENLHNLHNSQIINNVNTLNLQQGENSSLNQNQQNHQDTERRNFISQENQINNTININQPTNPVINNIPNVLNSHINTIEEIQRATNEEILNLFRQAINIRERGGNGTENNPNSLRLEIQELEEKIFEHLISNKVFIFSPFVLILLVSCLGLEINTMIKSSNFSFKTLETEVMWIPYCLTLLIMVLILWNFYLLLFKIFTGFCERYLTRIKIKYLFELGIADVLYFNPFYFNMIIFHFDKTYLSTNFDLFANMSIATHYMINFLFANLIFNFFKYKIANITNLQLSENKYLIQKMRFLFSFLIFMNLLTSYTITYLTAEADFYYIYLMQHKCFYLVLKEIGMWYENETAYKQLDNYYATNEQYYLNSIFIKMIIQLFVMVLIVQILFFGNMLFCKRGAYIFFVPCLFICIRTIYEFFKVFKNYEEIKLFFDKLDCVFPKENITDKDVECSICTENLTKARKLSCNHYFHLICLSKWIEKGKKNCPLCRKEIQENVNAINRNRSNSNGEYIFRFSFSSQFFSWIPNLTIRLGRTNNIIRVEPMNLNNINGINNSSQQITETNVNSNNQNNILFDASRQNNQNQAENSINIEN